MAPSRKHSDRSPSAVAPLHAPGTYSFGEYELDAPRFELRRAEQKVPVEPKVLDLLLLLVRSRDRIVLRKEVLDALWPGVKVSEASLWRVVLEARRAIGDDEQTAIVTVRGRGFRFAAAAVTEKGAEDRVPTTASGPSDPRFVGREAPLAAVEARLADATAGRGSLVWLSGEAGIGKTRLADEIARRAQLRGARVLTAHAQPADEAPPLWLLAEILRRHAQAGGEEAARLAAEVSTRTRGKEPPDAPARFALFEAVLRSFGEASRQRALVIVIDDLHWADEASLRLLVLLAREVRNHAWLVVGTYRDGAVRADACGQALGGLIASTGSLGIPLRRFSLEEVARLAELHTGKPPSPAFAKALLERSGGNPLYVEQLLGTEWADRALAAAAHELASTMDLQRGILETIGRHLDEVSDAGRQLLTLAAVLGKEFGLAELGVVSGLPAEALLDHLDEAVRASILVKARDGRHRFSHVLVRDVLRKRLSSAERAAMHRTIGEKLLAHHGDANDVHSVELADHFLRALPAGDPERAIDLGMRAAERQARLGRHKDAAKLWHRTAGALSLRPGDDPRRVTVQLGLAKALAAEGLTSEAREAFLDAALLAERFRHPQQLAEAGLGHAALADDGTQRQSLLERSLAALGGVGGAAARELEALVRAALDGTGRT